MRYRCTGVVQVQRQGVHLVHAGAQALDLHGQGIVLTTPAHKPFVPAADACKIVRLDTKHPTTQHQVFPHRRAIPRLRGQGATLGALLASADGRLALVAEPGRISRLLMEQMGLRKGELTDMVLDGKGRISREDASKKVGAIYDEFRKKQDAAYISEFDRQTAKYLKGGEPT